MQDKLFKSKEANEMLSMFINDGLQEVIQNYSLEEIAKMIQPDEHSQVNILFGQLMVHYDGAKNFLDALEKLEGMFDEDEWTLQQD